MPQIMESQNSFRKKNGSESLKGLHLYGFYLVILHLGVRLTFVKYKIQQKQKVFAKTFISIICFYTHREYVNTSAVSHRV